MQRPDRMELADAAEQKDSRKLWMDQRISGRSLVGVPVGTGVGGLVGTGSSVILFATLTPTTLWPTALLLTAPLRSSTLNALLSACSV